MTEEQFIELVKQGDQAKVREALSQQPALAQAKDNNVSAILIAVYNGQREIARLIADGKGTLDVHEAAALGDRHQLERALAADPNAHATWSSEGFSPLALAAFFGHREAAQDLLKAGAGVNVKVKNPFGVMPLHSALANQHKEIVRDLIAHGADVNAAADGGWTPLHYTAYYGDIETTKLLLEKGARSTERNGDGKTPAEFARERGHTDLEKLLEPNVVTP